MTNGRCTSYLIEQLYVGLFQVCSRYFREQAVPGAAVIGGFDQWCLTASGDRIYLLFEDPSHVWGSSLLRLEIQLLWTFCPLGQLFILLVAMGVAFVVNMYAIRFLRQIMKNHDFTVFRKYRTFLVPSCYCMNLVLFLENGQAWLNYFRGWRLLLPTSFQSHPF